MSEDKTKEEQKNENPNMNNNVFKKGFFKKVWYSITKIEKYGEMATEGVARALSYLSKLTIILAIVLSVWVTFQTSNSIKQAMQYIQNDFPEFSYKDGRLQVESEEPITIENDTINGKIIVDTNTDSEEIVNQYTNSINEYGGGIVILKDRVIIANIAMTGSISYNYKEIFDSLQISEFTKDTVIQYSNSGQMATVYISVFITLFIYTYVWYLIKILWYAVVISIFGYLAAWILKIKMRYAPIFNMSIYASTLSVILNLIYIVVNMFTTFTIQYFDVMYSAVATIYLISAIFIIKTEFIKKQAELMKIAEVQATVRKETEEQKRKDEEEKRRQEKEKEGQKEKERKEEKRREKQDDEENKKDENGSNVGETPEGSNA